MIKQMNENAKRFCSMRQGLEMIYDSYARSVGISYTTLFVLNLISQYEVCTQKIICERTMLPKQTVNNVVKKLAEQGYLRLEEIPGNNKSKRILFTEEGKEYAEPMIKHIQDAEDTAMEQLFESHQEELLCIMELYDHAFRKAMNDK
ncbi:MarR family winged helix-turn-helix transcriptional regulator [Lacrimispora sp.]|uniref:MarR family winged helix-turn-helix transcriptional regulator n=1 Tax=Lacrimispora sp. TaxID=2719234 RepID=UPI0028B14FA9|nr:MarR family transcriptional regulator [Lacrimispora sp.]